MKKVKKDYSENKRDNYPLGERPGSIVTGEWRERGAGNSGLERPEETRLQRGHLNSSGWDQMREREHIRSQPLYPSAVSEAKQREVRTQRQGEYREKIGSKRVL